MGKTFLAFDLGASSGRAILGILQAGKLELREVHRFANGPVETEEGLFWDYPALCSEIVTGLKKALEVTGDIASLGIDTWGVDYVLFDREKNMVRLPYHYRDDRTQEIMASVQQAAGGKSKLYETTGIQCMSFNTIYQLAAHAAQHPEDLRNARFLMMPDALELALGGDFSTEYTDASTGELLEPRSRTWNFELMDQAGIPRDIFPELVQPCTGGGVLKPTLQRELNAPAIPIIKVGSHDTASAVAAVPAEPGKNWAYLSCGTWALLGAELPEVKISPETEKAPFTNEGGLDHTIRFLTNIMGCWLIQETRNSWKKQGHDYSFGELSDMAVSAEPFKFLIDPNDQRFFAPGDMPSRIAEFIRETGQGEIGSNGAILRCIYDSLALYFASKLGELERILQVRYSAFNVVGGGTRDEELMQCTADALGIKVLAGPVEATAIGNLLAQAIALGEVEDLAAAREVVRNSFEVVEYLPRADRTAAVAEAKKRFQHLVK